MNDAADTKRRILAAAEAEFLACGYDRARMQAISDRARINKALLHYHFRSKDELFAQIFREKARDLFPRIEAGLRANTDVIALTCDFIELYIDHMTKNPFLPSYLLQISTNHVELLAELASDFPSRYVRALEAAARRNAIRRVDPRQFLVSLLGMCMMPFVGENLLRHLLRLDDAKFRRLLAERVGELKRYAVLMLTPEPARTRRGQG